VEAALIAVIGAVVGIVLTNGIKLLLDARERTERVRDIQTALRAEIRSHRRSLEVFSEDAVQSEVLAHIETEPGYSPFVNRELEPFIFDAIVGEIHVLPGAVIDPVILYYRQWRILGILAEDMRSESFARLPQARKAAIYADYRNLGLYAIDLGKDAIDVLNASLDDDGGS
jgi:hypothetical protein